MIQSYSDSKRHIAPSMAEAVKTCDGLLTRDPQS